VLLLDTDHVVEYQKGTSAAARRLESRLEQATEPIATTIVTVEEIVRGWLAAVRRSNDPSDWILPYNKLQGLFDFFADWSVMEWTEPAARKFKELRRDRVRVKTMDVKIACIALTLDATLLSANAVDFEKIPGLRFENWLS
jgi:tRNA(fMet)-specific endonuclease VapC